MIEIKYDLVSYHNFLEQVSKSLGVKIIDNTIYIPANLGYGYIKHIELATGLDAILTHFKLSKDLVLQRKKNNREFYTFCCDFVSEASEFKMSIASDIYQQEAIDLSAMYLTSFLYDIVYYIKKDSQVDSIRILLTPEWMKKNLAMDEKKEVVQQYIELKTGGLLFKKPDAEARQIMADIFSSDVTRQQPLFYHSRLLWLLEKFCSWLTPEIMSRPNAVDISRSDIEKVRKVESMITSDFSSPPLTIAKLAKSVAVSESKLKTLFKAVYGLPIYEYFQKHRMEKARVMLLSNEYSIKDVGYAVGYANLSNFTLAFKKQFNQLPSELLK